MDTEKTSQGPANSGPVLPLAMLGEGETALIVTVKGARLGLNRQMSSHIMVSPL